MFKIRVRRLPSGSTNVFLDNGVRQNRRRVNLGTYPISARELRRTPLWKEFEARRIEEDQKALFADSPKTGMAANTAGFVEYLRSVQARHRARKNTFESWDLAIRHVERFLGGRSVLLVGVTNTLLLDFKAYLLSCTGHSGKPMSPNSASTHFSKIRTALLLAKRERLIRDNPSEGITFRYVKPSKQPLSKEELTLLMRTPCENEHVRNAFLFSCYSNGLRHSDLRALTWGVIAAKRIVIYQVKTGNAVEVILPEQSKRIVERQHALFIAANGVEPSGSEHVFNLPPQQTVDKTLKRWALRARLGRTLSMHIARHTFSYLAGIVTRNNVFVVAQAIGDKTMDVVQDYMSLLSGDLHRMENDLSGHPDLQLLDEDK